MATDCSIKCHQWSTTDHQTDFKMASRNRRPWRQGFIRKKLPRHLLIGSILLTLAVIRVVYEHFTQKERLDIEQASDFELDPSLEDLGVPRVIFGEHQSFLSRRLLDLESNCSKPAIEDFPRVHFGQEARQHGAFLLYAALGVYMFAAIAIACDDYFVPACEKFCKLFKLSEDVAGATFMAAGSSAPELATTCIGVFVTKDDIGIGTVVGSAVFNILCVIGICALFAGMVVELHWWPLFRDCMVYSISIVVLVLVLYDELVMWYEAMILLLLYLCYTVLMYNNTKLEDKAHQLVDRCRGRKGDESSDETVPLKKGKQGKHETFEDANSNSEKSSEVAGDSQSTADDLLEETPWVLAFPDSTCKRVTWIISLPLTIVMFLTVPDCRQPRWTKWYPFTFLMSCLWLALFSYIMVWMITIVGFTFNIPDTVMGLTFIAAGASVPDAIASLIVVREGHGDMAVSNAVASNVFDILVCLGLPWFIQTAMVTPNVPVPVYGDGLTTAALTLLSTVVFLIVATHINGWRLTILYGVILIVLYVAYIVFAILYALNVFGHVSVQSLCATEY